MIMIRESVSIRRRYKGNIRKLDPYKNYYLSVEGIRTEPLYLKHLINNRRELGILDQIELVPLERTHRDEGRTQPEELLEIILEFRKARIESGEDSQQDDVYCIMFDKDSFKNELHPNEKYFEFIKRALDEGIEVIVTNPCFELWLILHKEHTYQRYILPKYRQLLRNRKINSTDTVASKMFKDIFGYSPKSYVSPYLINDIDVAIKQSELFLSQNPFEFDKKLGETFSTFIKKITK